MPYPELRAALTDIGTEELGHFEMVASMVHQLTRNMTSKQIEDSGFDLYFVNHTAGVYPQDSAGVPFSASTIAVSGDTIADLSEDMAS